MATTLADPTPSIAEPSIDLQGLVGNAIDGIFIIDRNRRLVEFNRACEKLTGYSRQDVLGKNMFCAHAIQCQNAEGVSMAGNLCAGKDVFSCETSDCTERMRSTSKDGTERWIETHYTPIHGSGGEVEYVMGIMRDISSQVALENDHARLEEELVNYRREIEARYDFSNVIGTSKPILEALELAGEVATSQTTVLVTGESGTGKELLARAIHFNSPRSGSPFVAVNCPAHPEKLIERELFGFEKGAFPGADQDKPGRFELAKGGTLFLDEISEMDLPTQAKLLRVLREQELEHIGGTRSTPVDVRLIVATNRNLEELVQEQNFLQDLYYCINVFPIHLPALHERPADILPLAEHFLERFCNETGKQVPGISREARSILMEHPWEGNVRELQNVIERGVILSKGELITPDHIPDGSSKAGSQLGSGKGGTRFQLPKDGLDLESVEKSLMEQALDQAKGNKTKAASLLGLSRSTLRYRLEKFGLD